ncbi:MULTISPECIES: MAPEG family protein [unclassified Sphingomonas]|uniref:MAPEG family protein n=1 Tax=unclassified Sphingomonas TaxID=196159 RepID=UPI00226AC4DD|nr:MULTISPECIES: MAPEG family protein [unclassified Sphingomonas]
MILPVTLTIAAALAVVNLWLAFRIVPTRLRDKVLVGDNGDARLHARMRAQANLVEYAPFVLILLALIELGGGSPMGLWILGMAFVIARILHGFGMDRLQSNPLRAGGALATWVILAVLAGWALAMAYGAREAGLPGTLVVAPVAHA